MKKDVRLIIYAVILVGLASLACMSAPAKKTSADIKDHGFYEGLTNWKYYNDGKLENETKFSYDEKGNLEEIKVYNLGKPHIFSYLDYYTLPKSQDDDDKDKDKDKDKDDEEKEITYRVLKKQEFFNVSRNERIWLKEIEIIVVDNYPLIKTLAKTGKNGVLIYKDEYEYDKKGRTLSSIRTYKDGTITRHEYSYEDGATLGVKKSRYYMNTPEVYFARNKYINFVTDAHKKITLKDVPGFWFQGSYYYTDLY
ncbi:MAG: hypothetical protein JXJ04_08245 [Spirochaetales bacterium]|nr:hypothetical protein [Spirochaetales bacterium]